MIDQYSFLSKLLIEDSVNVLLKDNDSLVAVIVNAEIESEDNFYLCKIMFVYNNNFIFGTKEIYNNLDGKMQNDLWYISYSTLGKPFDGWYKNYILLENEKHQKVYIELECMYDDLTYILENIL